MKSSSFPVARLQERTLKKVQELEERLREETGEEIVLIAYKHEKTSQEGNQE
ncbi:hypothetical protein ABET52_17560 [Saccharococcus caldoxylosilyticus]|uniref:hypothetical protein n=1 Tax=Saccharococcus caldoxylosilyticus TaxID=81408 RepID=UPI001C4DDA4A|nr:hypothetical protein [Parageobacillus caldoxylosilyticus]QXJ37654.1 hypothetical protein BV455_00916 [Parageobacillus caldoxylosilyticus]